jgi:curved DNA-binding protein CbpA
MAALSQFMVDPYAVLALPPTATVEEIKKAYFAQVRAHPPERDPEMFKKIRAAYEQLKTPEKKLESDMLRLADWEEPPLEPASEVAGEVAPEDVWLAARALTELERTDWREDLREVKTC